MLLNLDDDPIEFDLALSGFEALGDAPSATLAVTSSPDPEGPELTIGDPVAVEGVDDGRATLVLPPWSMNLMEVTPSA